MPARAGSPRDAGPWAADEASVIADVGRVRAILVEAARDGRAVTYSEALRRLGLSFTRPKMRALCRTLDRIDREGAAAGEPGLAVLVVRASDGLPGQGWWVGGRAERLGWTGDWTGPAARALVEREQAAAFAHWSRRG